MAGGSGRGGDASGAGQKAGEQGVSTGAQDGTGEGYLVKGGRLEGGHFGGGARWKRRGSRGGAPLVWRERQERVSVAFRHAWRGYKEYAFGADELLPSPTVASMGSGPWGPPLWTP